MAQALGLGDAVGGGGAGADKADDGLVVEGDIPPSQIEYRRGVVDIPKPLGVARVGHGQDAVTQALAL